LFFALFETNGWINRDNRATDGADRRQEPRQSGPKTFRHRPPAAMIGGQGFASAREQWLLELIVSAFGFWKFGYTET
jgi:hypothetical protein